MNYRRLARAVPLKKRASLADKLVDVVLLSKNDERMPSRIANVILHYWQEDALSTEPGLTVLLEAAVLLELDKTVEALVELELPNLAEQIRKVILRS